MASVWGWWGVCGGGGSVGKGGAGREGDVWGEEDVEEIFLWGPKMQGLF